VSSRALFTVTIEPLDDACRIRASGELDRSSADRLSSALDAARADGVTTLLDLSAVSFIDSAGLRVLLRSARAVDAHNWAWFIVRASRVVWRLVEVSGTTSQLPLVAPAESTERIATLTGAVSKALQRAAPDYSPRASGPAPLLDHQGPSWSLIG
jgi:anti-sigma B factor antagonist